MKAEFANIKSVNTNSVFFLYGNYKRTFFLFCNFVIDKIKAENTTASVNIHYCNVAECSKIMSSQCDLFGETINVFCIRSVEDSHLDKLLPMFEFSNNVFVLESGDYGKSKKITAEFTKSARVSAVASFKNDITLMSLCRLILPKTSSQIHREVIYIINRTDEDLYSLFTKISLLLEENADISLSEYETSQRSFINDMEFIPFLRYTLKLAIKAKLTDNNSSKFYLSKENIVELLLDAELKYKYLQNLPKSYLYKLCM